MPGYLGATLSTSLLFPRGLSSLRNGRAGSELCLSNSQREDFSVLRKDLF